MCSAASSACIGPSRRKKIGFRPENFCELRYEDLVRDPVAQMETIYDHLQLGDFELARPKIEAYMQSQKDYKTNRHQISPEIQAEISRRWSPFMRQYGYDCEPVAVGATTG